MEASPDKTTPPFGRYLIRERIAQGGMGEVFMAVAVGADGFEKAVVVKRLLPKFAGRAEVASLLSSEAKLMTRLVHPNIVQVIDFGRGESDDYFLVMELVNGTDLGRFCNAYIAAHQAVPVRLALFITTQVLRGLAYAHATVSVDGKTLVHRDISPGNVLVSTFGEVKVADFGVALIANSADDPHDGGWFVGKPAYTAPEQLERRPVDERADIYAVGAVLFQALTGTLHRPEMAPCEDATARSELSKETRDALARVASPHLAEVIARALAPRREDRFANAREMSRAIDQLVEKGEKMATADDLAAAVSELVQARPKRGQSVVVLSAGDREGLASGTELTHIGTRGSQGFTIKVQDVGAMADPAGQRSAGGFTRSRWIGISLFLASLGVALAIFLLRSTPRPSSAAPREVNVSVAPAPPSVPADPPRAPVDPPATGPAVSSTRAPASVAAEHPAHRAKEHPAAAPAPSASSQPAPECRGQIHLYAAHGWVISGGPGPVQAPGRYEWPCGTYGLRAASRVNPSDVREVTVTVRETKPGVIDLR